jgi:hypothetical protein
VIEQRKMLERTNNTLTANVNKFILNKTKNMNIFILGTAQ